MVRGVAFRRAIIITQSNRSNHLSHKLFVVFFLFILGLCAFAVSAQTKRPVRTGKVPASSGAASGTEAQLRKLEAAWIKAMIEKDTATLANLYADDFLAGNDDGSLLKKADVMKMGKAGLPFTKITTDEFKLRVYGTTAVVNSNANYFMGERKLASHYQLTVWQRRAKGWQVVSWQTTPITRIKLKGPKAMTTESGLQYEDIVEGTGASPKVGQTVKVHYTGTLTDGTKFDSSVDRGQPFDFTIGVGRVIRGWDEGVMTMKVGGKRTLVIPPSLGYGSQANGPIPANSTLIFEVELLGVQ